MAEPLTRRSQEHAQDSSPGGRLLMWFVLLSVAFWPRLWILGFWIFSDTIGNAFSGWVVVALGFLFLPWTTLMYVIAWSPVGGVEGAEWLLVALGLALDIATYSARAARGKTSYY